MKLSDQYFQYMITGNSDAAYRMECYYGLDGYTPELVSVGLKAIDEDNDPYEAINDYANYCNDGAI